VTIYMQLRACGDIAFDREIGTKHGKGRCSHRATLS
jgi:hypothetical protein